MRRIAAKWSALATAVVLTLASAGVKAQQQPGSIHGHVQNAAGMAINHGDVKLTQDRTGDEKNRKYLYTLPIDANGDYKGSGITPGSYLVVVFVENKSMDFFDNVTITAGQDKQQDFDMTRKEYVDKMTPEEKKQLEEYKKKNAEVTQANQKIANLNTLLTQARADTKAGNYDAAITSMTQATQQKPDEAILWVALGDAQLGSADNAAKAAHAAGKPVASDTTITQKYQDAVTSYKKAVDDNAASKKPNVETAAAANNQLGQAYAKLGQTKEASDAYEAAAKAAPANAGMYFFNEAATLYNTGHLDEAGVAADKAIAADPKRADAYYIKVQALAPKVTTVQVDKNTSKNVAPPGLVEACQEYLDIAPTGPHAADMQAILQALGESAKTSFKAGKKK
jgi:tetratricopeptide (TPR) repeat protein